MPKPVRELLRLVHVEQIDLSQVKRVDFEIISYLKESHADLYRTLRRAVKGRNRAGGAPLVLDDAALGDVSPASGIVREAEAQYLRRRTQGQPLALTLVVAYSGMPAAAGSSFLQSAATASSARFGGVESRLCGRFCAPQQAWRRWGSNERRARVIPFDRLRMADIETVGGKNASLGEMMGELRRGHPRPRGLLHRLRVSRVSRAQRPEARIAARLATLDVDDARPCARRRRDPKLDHGSVAAATAARRPGRIIRRVDCRGAACDMGGALVGNSRGPAGRVLCRPAGDISKYQWLG